MCFNRYPYLRCNHETNFLPAAILLTALSSFTASADEARILAFGDSNTWGWSPTSEGFPAGRFEDDTRWAGVLDNALPEATVIVDGMIGRRSDIDGRNDNGLVRKEDFNGAAALPAAIARNMPLDLVVIMLGTNDLQAGTERAPADIAQAVFKMAADVSQSAQTVFTHYPAPDVLVVGPAAMGDTSKTGLSGLFQAGEAASEQLSAAFTQEAARTGITFFDASKVTDTDGIDGVHFSASNHETLGKALAPVVLTLIND
ncbi:DUF459 domain-containing protein [Aliamphritea spongicola]|nr:GDSL-type esterase/lipase family protein [Aliamphritea spongicola]